MILKKFHLRIGPTCIVGIIDKLGPCEHVENPLSLVGNHALQMN